MFKVFLILDQLHLNFSFDIEYTWMVFAFFDLSFDHVCI